MTATTRRRGLVAVVGAALTVVAVLVVAAIIARVDTGDLWPTMLTDWSLGSALCALTAVGVGAVITLRLERNLIGWLFLALGVLTAGVTGVREYTEMLLAADPSSTAAVWGAWVFAWAIAANVTVLALLVLLFPDGSPPTRQWRPVVWLVVVVGALATLASMVSPYTSDQTMFAGVRNPVAVLSPGAGRAAVEVTTLSQMALWLVAAGSMVRRLRRARGVERLQLKWFAFAAVLAFGTFFPGFWIQPLFVFATLIGFPALPIAAGLAIWRYRLYDIDRLINRTVVYAGVTGVLALAYLVVVAAMRTLTAPITGDAAPAVAISTLAVAALFQPVRRRIQAAVDRRFNRARYDAAATVQHLRLQLRDEVDLDALKVELMTTVHVTMQPTGATLWLRKAEQ